MLRPGVMGCQTIEALEALIKDFEDKTIPAPAGCVQIRAPVPVTLEYVGHFDVEPWRIYTAKVTNPAGKSLVIPVTRKPLKEVLGYLI